MSNPSRISTRADAADSSPSSGPSAGRLSLTRPIAVKAWKGASGRWYIHTAFHLVGCPELTSAAYVFVRRTHLRQQHVVGVGYTESTTASLNLAALRQRGASLGATEVHVCDVEGPLSVCAKVAFDLEAALMAKTANPSA